MRVMTVMAMAAALWSAPAYADSKYDAGLLLGSTQATDEGAALQSKRATTYQATFHVRLWAAGSTTVGVEMPFIASPAFSVDSQVGTLPKSTRRSTLRPACE